MTELTGSILRNVNTPDVGIFVSHITQDEFNYVGKVRYFPMHHEDKTFEEAVDLFVRDDAFIFPINRFYEEFEILTNPGEIKSFKDAEWGKMRAIK